MTPDREKILRKVRACLRLSRSSNEHEAAAALRQAQKLMSEHGIDPAAVEFDISSDDAPTRHRGAMPPQSTIRLASLIARGFSCHVVVVTGGTTVMRFYGVNGAAEVAVYAFTVLRRQLEAAKQRHVRRCRKRVVKEQRAEVFAIGWVEAVHALFPTVDVPANLASAYEAAFAADARGQRTQQTTGREIGRERVKFGDHFAGYMAGKSARYSPGVKGRAQRAIGSD